MDLLDTHTGSTRSGMHAPALLAMTLLILACLLTGLTEVGSASPLERNALPSVLRQPSDPVPGEGLSAAVAAVPANSAALDAALDEQKKLTEKQVRAQQELQRTDEEIQDATLRREASTELLARRSEQVTKAAETQQKLRGALRTIGVEWFITGFGRLSALNPTVSSAERERLDRARVLSESAASSTISKERFAREQLKQLQEERSDLQRQLAEIEDSLGQLSSKSQGLTASLELLGEQLAQNEQRVAEARMSATINGTDLSTGALDAYWRAAVSLQDTNPSCAIPWWAIAGIGRTESKHGTYRGASLGRDGLVSPPIFGPELDGTNAFAIVRDSDGGALDGTATTDRAVGPMQFLPSSWKAVARDATGDGVADPQNLYDAALTAGAYLCRKGPGLNQEGPLRAAYLSYNRSQRYVDIVMSQAFDYQRSVPLA
ncbi:MAG: hypothetical protein F2744_04030 [Actinobacteria bacterium]|uniref:Unannotated protein n=1 Tax=freshwater metagenome TaxID=449393 RepID=A0A6J6YCI5_9ZZZZ|nr:hypothetical protein [Actinomycetota bacterium]